MMIHPGSSPRHLKRRRALLLGTLVLLVPAGLAAYFIAVLGSFPGVTTHPSGEAAAGIVEPRFTQPPFGLDEANGYIRLGESLSPERADLPALTNLDPGLLKAVRSAARDARGAGIELGVNSGWRSEALQEWMLTQAIKDYGSESIARRFVSTPESSRHVSGEAVDIGPTDAAAWVEQHGNRYGLCRIYANEPWHFELATTPGGSCPALRTDAS
ncbi:M15 family metallopeptidase [Mycetocola lacteus]|nr:M15 family metallopeptidase [Mycetocola lacteus]